MTSSNAAWVLAGARLISSANRRLVNTGPCRSWKVWLFMSNKRKPVTSEGIRSGVNWIRPEAPPKVFARVVTR